MRSVLSSLALMAVVGCGTDPPVATTLDVTPEEALLVSLGETVLLTAEIEDQYGDPMVGEAVTWASDRSGIATVSGGTVTAVANGTASVTATVGQLTGTATVTVAQRAHTVFVTPDRVLLGPPGEEAQMTVQALDARGSVIDRPSVTWTTADPAVATVTDGGLVTSVADGETTVEARVGAATGTATILVDQQRAGLMVLYDSTAGEGWVNSENWGTAAELGEWYGVETDVDGNVHSLVLGGNNLVGTIPAAVGLLDEIRILDLSDNSLEGGIPPETFVSTLDSLFLGNNDLGGEIPEEIGEPTGLATIGLADNDLEGEIPESFGNLDLTALYIHSNQLSGEVPAGIPLSTPVVLEMHGNELWGDLPREFVGNSMTRFSWNDQDGLCSPEDDQFQSWLATIPSHEPGPVCPSREFREDFDTAGSLNGWEAQYARISLQDSMLALDSADDGGGNDEVPQAYRKLRRIESDWVLKTSATVEDHDDGSEAVATIEVHTGDARHSKLSVDLDIELGEWYIWVYDADEDEWDGLDDGGLDAEFGELVEVEWEFADGVMILTLDGEEVSNSSQDVPKGTTGIGLGMYFVLDDEDKALFDYIDIRPKG